MHIWGQRKKRELKISNVIDSFLSNGQYDCYLEPFCGGCGVAKRIKTNIHKICSDISEDLILMWQALMNKWKPPTTVNLDSYLHEKNMAASARRGFIGYCCSDDGRFFGEYDGDNRAIKSRAELLVSDSKKLSGSEFGVADFAAIRPSNLFVYCDPPLQGTIYEDPNFDYNKFWSWVRYFGKESGNKIIVSASVAPSDFRCLQYFEQEEGMFGEGLYQI